MFAVVECPQRVDKNALLVAADELLNAAHGGDPTNLDLARRMALRACDWAVFGRPENYVALRRAIECYRLYILIK